VSVITRTWIAFAAIGIGLIHVALVIGSPLALALPLGILGAIEFGWGVYAFTRDDVPTPRVAMVVAITPLVVWGLLVAGASTFEIATLATVLDVVPWGVAAIFQLFVAGTLARHFRRMSADTGTVRPAPSAGRYLTGLMVGALAVSALVTPALAATEAGIYAQPHGEHDGSFTPQRDVPVLHDEQFTIPGHVDH